MRGVKLIAEPWDVGARGYQVGNFPVHWSEWNGRYRDTVRDLWRGTPGALSDFGSRFTGSADLYRAHGRRPYASVNFVTAHDGFTLADLVSYERKHNEANGDANHDGESFNHSWNNGVEGPTDDPVVLERRARQQRSLLATLLLSQGVPMLLGGDELGRTQHGNNNAYCHDNEISWYDWAAADLDLLDFTRRLVRFRRSHPVFHRRRWFEGGVIGEAGLLDIGWFAPDGSLDGPAEVAGLGRQRRRGLHVGRRARRRRRPADRGRLVLHRLQRHRPRRPVPPAGRATRQGVGACPGHGTQAVIRRGSDRAAGLSARRRRGARRRGAATRGSHAPAVATTRC